MIRQLISNPGFLKNWDGSHIQNLYEAQVRSSQFLHTFGQFLNLHPTDVIAWHGLTDEVFEQAGVVR